MFIVTCVLVIVACNTDELEFDDIELQPITGTFAFPLGETSYLMGDLLLQQTDTLDFQQDSTGLFTLVYYDTINYNVSDDFVQIDDVVENTRQASIRSITENSTGTGQLIVPFAFSFDDLEYNAENGEILDSLFYTAGELTIESNSTVDAIVNYTYTLASTTNTATGNPVQLNGTIPANGSDVQNQSLIGHVTKPSGDENRFPILLNLEVLVPAATVVSEGNIDITVTFANQSFGLIHGKFGQDTVQVSNQSIEIDFFTQAEREGITFGNPQLTFDFRNSFGIPVAVDFSGLNGDDGNGGDQFFLTGQVVNNRPVIAGSDINSPAVNTPGETAQSIIEINRTNSNLVALLGSSPQRLVFDVSGISNPNGSNTPNYLQPTSEITAFVEMEIPMEIQMENLQEKGFFSLDGGIPLENIDSAFIRVLTVNELPFSGTVALEIQDADSNVLYTVADNLVISAPFININGIVTDPNGTTVDIPLSSEGVAALDSAARVAITLTLSTPVSQTSRDIFVKILADYELTLKVGLAGRFNLEIE